MDKIVSEKTELRASVESILVDSFSKILRVNVITGEYEVYKNDGLLDDDVLGSAPDIYSCIQKLIADEVVYPEYAAACGRFANPEYVQKRLFSGEKRIAQNYRRRTSQGDKWVTFAIIAGKECTPKNPIVLFAWREADANALTLLDTLPTISSLYDDLIRINLSNYTYEPVVVDAYEEKQLVGGVIDIHEWWAVYSKDIKVDAEYIDTFNMLAKVGSLQKYFAEDPTPINFRFRKKIGDEYRWMQLQIAPSVKFSEENQIVLLSLKDIHEEYMAQVRSRQELIDSMNHDALTRLFNRLKYNEDIENLEKSNNPVFTCLYVDVNGLHELNNLLGHQKGDDMLCCVADALRKYFPDENVYRIGGDEFVVLSTNLSKQAVELAVEKMRDDLRRDNYEISAGIESGTCGKDVENIVAIAEQNMRDDKAAYYMRKGNRRRERKMNEQLEKMLVEKRDEERFLDIIASQFSGVYFVDLASDTARYIFTPKFFSELLEEVNASFSAAARLYVEKTVKQEYHSYFDDILDYDKLDKKLNEEEIVQFTYQKTDGGRINVRIHEIDRQENGKPETIWIFAEEKN